MAKALECPACGAKHSVDGREPSSTFRCERCGQALKVPASVVVAQAASGARNVTPPPRRRAGAPPSQIVGATATLPATDAGNGGRPAEPAPPRAPAPAPRTRAHWYWRLAAWIVAVPVAFVVTAWPAYEFGLIRKDDVLDVFVGSGTGRYTRLAVFTLIWALVTAVLVQLLVEGGRWWSRRRRAARRSTPTARRAATGS
jgi:hypothetical protein